MATGAHAGSNECVGTVDVGPELTTITDTHSSSLRDDQFGPDEPRLCQFKTNSPLGKRILRVCPEASECTLQLSINNNPSELASRSSALNLIQTAKSVGVVTGKPSPAAIGDNDDEAPDRSEWH